MPINTEVAGKVWSRYEYLRDNGHNDYIAKAEECERFFRGLQWSSADLVKLAQQRRPALTINKILSTVSNVLGEQIYNRTDINFQPRSGADPGTAEALTKVFRQIADNNLLDWKRGDVFCDGIITSRGFFDVRLDFTDAMEGEVRINALNPKNTLIDADAEEYDPDTWNDVLLTKWMTWEDIAILYNPEDAELLKNRTQSWYQYGFDSIERSRDRFGPDTQRGYQEAETQNPALLRNIRVIEQQQRRMAKQRHFVDTATGDMRAIPDDWSRNRIAQVVDAFGVQVVEKLIKRIRWTVIADNVVLHDAWSPFEHFTVVPFFPYFRRGKTVGIVENLIGPQELLNKVTSQELHVVNTTANSGWILKEGSLKNLTIEELEQRGAETGLVLTLADVGDAQKIQPNQVPSGLDRVSYKAEEHIKTISGVSDYQTGAAREDVSAKAVQENLKRGSLNQAKSTDSLNRTDYMLSRMVLSIVQRFYTEPRLINITHNKMTGEQAQVQVNQPTPEGSIVNDLTLGEYDIVITSVPHRQTLETSQFEQAMSLREQGVPIPDDVIIEHSSLYRKNDILKKMAEAAQSDEAVHQAEVQKMAAELELANLKAEAAKTEADAVLKQAKAQKESTASAIALKEAQGGGADAMKAQAEIEQKQAEGAIELEIKRMELEIKREELALKREEMALKQQEAQMGLKVKAANAQADVQIASKKVQQQDQMHKQKMAQQQQAQKLKAKQEKRNG
jgi:hypothetical protein